LIETKQYNLTRLNVKRVIRCLQNIPWSDSILTEDCLLQASTWVMPSRESSVEEWEVVRQTCIYSVDNNLFHNRSFMSFDKSEMDYQSLTLTGLPGIGRF
jgi:hypothetical protein